MSTKTAKACMYAAMSALAALAFCPTAQAQPERQCYVTTAGKIVCIDLSSSDSTNRDCYLIPLGPRCFPTTLPERNGQVQLPGGQWASPLPENQWPAPGQESKWPNTPSDKQPAGVSEGRQPRDTRQLPDWDFISGR